MAVVDSMTMRWHGRSKLNKMLIVGLVAVSASLLPAAGSFVPGGGNVVFGGVANAACKWDGKPGPGSLTNQHNHNGFGWAKVVTGWCYDGVHVTSRHSEKHAQVTGWGYYNGYLGVRTYWKYSACHQYRGIYNHNCLTRAEVFAYGSDGKFEIACIHTRIYGNGAHSRLITDGNCKTTP